MRDEQPVNTNEASQSVDEDRLASFGFISAHNMHCLTLHDAKRGYTWKFVIFTDCLFGRFH